MTLVPSPSWTTTDIVAHLKSLGTEEKEELMKFVVGASTFFLFAAELFASSAVAGEGSYTCKINRVYDLNDDGALKNSGWEKQFVGSTFSVSRVNGEIVGEVIPTLMANSTRVINSGSSEYSFKAVAEFDVNGPQIQLIEVQEFRSSLDKPFVATSMGGAGIVTGLCQ